MGDRWLRACAAPLYAAYDVALLDLDGVLYLQESAVPGAAEALAIASRHGMRREFVTNNASRSSVEVAALLCRVGVDAAASDVVTSGQAAVAVLSEQLTPGAEVLVVGAEALADEVARTGFAPVRVASPATAAVIQGYGPDVGWRALAEGAIAVRAGALWVATNGDLTFPSPRGPLPGNGTLVNAVAAAAGRGPDEIVGKPHPRLHRESIVRSRAARPLVVGDRLDTDILGAHRADTDSLLVLTGVTRPADLLLAPSDQRPTYVAAGLDGLLSPHEGIDGGEVRGWFAERSPSGLRLSGSGADPIDALRALCAMSWAGEPTANVDADDPIARDALGSLSLLRTSI